MLALSSTLPSAFYAAARKEPKLAHAEKLARGRVLRPPTFFEDVLQTILTTNTLWAATKRMNANLIATYGDPLPTTDKKAFPVPASIAASSPEVLKEAVQSWLSGLILSNELAVRVASDELELESLKTSRFANPGVTQRNVENQRHWPVCSSQPADDPGAQRLHPGRLVGAELVSHEWYDGEPVTPEQVEQHFEEWGEFKGLAYWFWDWKYEG